MNFKQAYEIVEHRDLSPEWKNPAISYRPKNGPHVSIPVADFDDPDRWAIQFESTDEEFNSAVATVREGLGGGYDLRNVFSDMDSVRADNARLRRALRAIVEYGREDLAVEQAREALATTSDVTRKDAQK